MGKLGILVGAGIGYVLGTRAGRERYDQIEQQARRVWRDPRVQQKKAEAKGVAQEKGEQLKESAANAGSGSGSSGGGRTSTQAQAVRPDGRTGVTSDDLPLSEPRPPLPTDSAASGESTSGGGAS